MITLTGYSCPSDGNANNQLLYTPKLNYPGPGA